MINWMSPLSFVGVLGVIFNLISFFDEIPPNKQNSPRWDAAFCCVPSGAILFACVPYKGRQAQMSEVPVIPVKIAVQLTESLDAMLVK